MYPTCVYLFFTSFCYFPFCVIYMYLFFWKFSLPSLKQDSVGDKSSKISSEEIAKDNVASKDPEVGGLLVTPVTCNSNSSSVYLAPFWFILPS